MSADRERFSKKKKRKEKKRKETKDAKRAERERDVFFISAAAAVHRIYALVSANAERRGSEMWRDITGPAAAQI